MGKISSFFQTIAKKLDEYDASHNFTCDCCGREVFENERICSLCRDELPYNDEQFCPFCGRPVLESGACLECKQKPLVVERARSVFLHEEGAVALVMRLKKGDRYLFRTLATEMLPLALREFPDVDLLVGVPMTERAQKARGYNQSFLLAQELARLMGKEYLDALVKTRETQEQKSLGRREREENLRGCFRVTQRSAVKGKRILIVDDIMTTGSTASELAFVLLRAGAKQVNLITATAVPQKIFR